MGAAVIATIGGIMRAGWRAVAAMESAGTLALATVDITRLDFEHAHAELMSIAVLGLLTSRRSNATRTRAGSAAAPARATTIPRQVSAPCGS